MTTTATDRVIGKSLPAWLIEALKIVTVLVVGVLVWLSIALAQWDAGSPLLVIDPLLGLAAVGLLRWRRSHTIRVAVLAVPIAAVSAFAAAPITVLLYNVGIRRKLAEIAPIGVAYVVAGTIYSLIDVTEGDELLLSIVFSVGHAAVTMVLGMYRGARKQLLETFRDRAVRAESEQTMRVEQARLLERERIAREMHDVLAHRISLVCMHAGALAYRTDATAEQVSESADIINTNAHQALRDLREVIGVLRQPGEGVDRPQPTLRELRSLIEEARAAGMRVDYTEEIEGDLDEPMADPASDTLGRTAYRIVQESLTNARKHAPACRVTVRAVGQPGWGLDLVVDNPLPTRPPTAIPGSGLGLVGLAERAALSGGELAYGQTPDRRFEVRARLPWPA